MGKYEPLSSSISSVPPTRFISAFLLALPSPAGVSPLPHQPEVPPRPPPPTPPSLHRPHPPPASGPEAGQPSTPTSRLWSHGRGRAGGETVRGQPEPRDGKQTDGPGPGRDEGGFRCPWSPGVFAVAPTPELVPGTGVNSTIYWVPPGARPCAGAGQGPEQASQEGRGSGIWVQPPKHWASSSVLRVWGEPPGPFLSLGELKADARGHHAPATPPST